MLAFCDLILILAALELFTDILNGTVPVDQQQLSGRECRPVDFICNICIDNDRYDLQEYHQKEHIRRENASRHHTQFRIDQHVRHQSGKYLGEDDLCIFQISQPHTAVSHGEKDQYHAVDTVLQQETSVPDLL